MHAPPRSTGGCPVSLHLPAAHPYAHRVRVGVVLFAALALALVAPAAAAAHAGDEHAAHAHGEAAAGGPPAAGGQPAEPAAMPPAAGSPQPGVAPDAPGPHAGHAGHVGNTTDVGTGSATAGGGGGGGGEHAGPVGEVAEPVRNEPPASAEMPPRVAAVSGGGGPAAATARPTGELPFTGVEENLLLISLAGMLVPIGVLLYCAARRGDLRLQLAMPRFHWAPSPKRQPEPGHPLAAYTPEWRERAFQWARR